MTASTHTEAAEQRYNATSPPIYVPLVILIVLTVLIWVLDLDLKTAELFYGGDGTWAWFRQPSVQWLYNYGTFPAIGIGSIALLVWIVSVFRTHRLTRRPLAMFLALALMIGPGLVVNTVFKQNFGRPRPYHVETFGGERSFLPAWYPGLTRDGNSFPSGHASTGFYWLCLGVFFWERNRKAAWAFILLGLIHGSLMGIGRMAQGAHWLSDILWSAGFVYLTSWILYRMLSSTRDPSASLLTRISHSPP